MIICDQCHDEKHRTEDMMPLYFSKEMNRVLLKLHPWPVYNDKFSTIETFNLNEGPFPSIVYRIEALKAGDKGTISGNGGLSGDFTLCNPCGDKMNHFLIDYRRKNK